MRPRGPCRPTCSGGIVESAVSEAATPMDGLFEHRMLPARLDRGRADRMLQTAVPIARHPTCPRTQHRIPGASDSRTGSRRLGDGRPIPSRSTV